jgi:acylphosphatase
MTTARHYLISGRVQGVWYRRTCQEQALQLGLTGWVRNLHDGRVEAIACGDEGSLIEFESWLGKGPPLARVDTVQIEATAPLDLASFETRPDADGSCK